MDAAIERRYTAFPPVLTRDTLFDIARFGRDALEALRDPNGTPCTEG
jgi:hypothetical protein